jgi:hypothetical protein
MRREEHDPSEGRFSGGGYRYATLYRSGSSMAAPVPSVPRGSGGHGEHNAVAGVRYRATKMA